MATQGTGMQSIAGTDLPGVIALHSETGLSDLQAALARNEIGRVAVLGNAEVGWLLSETLSLHWDVEILLAGCDSHDAGADTRRVADLLQVGHRHTTTVRHLEAPVTRIQRGPRGLSIVIGGLLEESVDRVILLCGTDFGAVTAICGRLTANGSSRCVSSPSHGG